jgi:hypothetical protein
VTAKLEMSDEAYAVLKEDIDGVKTFALQVRGMVPNHYWSRIDYLATDMSSILRDGVDVVLEPGEDTKLEADHPDMEKYADYGDYFEREVYRG